MLNKLFLKTLFTLSLVFAVSNTANATLITQDIWLDSGITTEIDYQYIGFITIDTEIAIVDDVFNDGSLILGTVSAWVDFELFGFNFWTEAEAIAAPGAFPMFGFFEAVFDVNNLAAGIELLQFDVTENAINQIAFNGFIDTFVPTGFLDIFDPTGALYDFGDLAFGEARLTAVPEPTSLLLFLAAAIGLTTRKKVK
ncbi:PEP-CTERM sorting domain-containing protein [Colwellia sp. 1_MG-2023]|uniref:PEP-CTERM sorting domain-containing protein n=1 Tax=unclassified Colwellia TaxID=196834 RepID=UPI001C08F681|nr:MULTISPECIES: PEP-CTERM sorting domain-containing protein [unclassified Colwellia]MBU2923427.1 PEP-CTERM sorting domain-containing protein [Colwellia sp. C2M11]MDO6653787.1 PEP-CTERM sorting domain-containing protein [Colwellia sp. 3_MG-2023]MDO6666701.1 PEP-CTERM sorting domain-containing protein [Colwellia sp. 2_MG-2023]MDO6691142.1 PEP-CTERM sorting domain-containing protein [Colwellia sp. 1_MG-2023]